jgi:hypothetical protein
MREITLVNGEWSLVSGEWSLVSSEWPSTLLVKVLLFTTHYSPLTN